MGQLMNQRDHCTKCKKTITENRTGLCADCRSIKCVNCGESYTPASERNRFKKTCYKCKKVTRKGSKYLNTLGADMCDAAIYGG